MSNKTSHRIREGRARSLNSPDLFSKPTHVAIMIGLILIGLLVGYILAFISFNRWHLRKRRWRHLKRGFNQSKAPVSTVDNDFYYVQTSASIYGTPDTYLTEDERRKLGMGKVKKHASVQTEQPTEPPKYENVVADGLYDYTMTYIVHQNIMSATLNSRRGAICNESNCKKSPMYERPKKTPPQIRHTDLMKFQEENCNTGDTDEYNYVDPSLINPKKDRSSRPKRTACECSSDSESEMEEVNKELVEYAKSLRLKKMAMKKEKLEYMSMSEILSDRKYSKQESSEQKSPKTTKQKLEPKLAKKQCPLKKKKTKTRGHKTVELTPELWEIIKSHTAKKKGAKNSRSSSKLSVAGKENNSASKTGSEDDGPYCKMSKLSSRGDTSTDDGDMDYIDVIM